MTTNYSKLETTDQLGFFTMELEVDPLFASMPEEIKEKVTEEIIKCKDLNDLTPGDYIRITYGEHFSREGIFVVSGPRVSGGERHYFFEEIMPRYNGKGKEKTMEKRGFVDFSDNPRIEVEILTKGYKPNYELDDPNTIYSKLVEKLKEASFVDRFKAYQDFCSMYPQYEANWSKFLSGMWDKAILEVTTPEEVEAEIMDKKHKHGREYNSSVKSFLEYVFHKVEPSKRPDYINGIYWSDQWFDSATDTGVKYLPNFNDKSVFVSSYAELLKVTDNEKVFNKIFDNWGVTSDPIDVSVLERDYVSLNTCLDETGLWLKKSLAEQM
ncbi:hypothetical protein [Priestia megaterium]|uniref:Uncharacterized protein n=1 Tax=Priestia megaterium TaxID=1404 RepID=A0A6M6E0E4_PRIMG|nr:hypothetical protein [Priestia megaterium]QJX80310.1 hypothetical protein FDZ14_29915 [Priestia megaterium]